MPELIGNSESDDLSTLGRGVGSPQLTVVMPVFNEEACIANVVTSWIRVLEGEGIDFRMLVIDDGSSDGTLTQLVRLAEDPRVQILHQANCGHGPTILAGYRTAVLEAEWIFQCDSDDEMEARHFPLLWRRREDYDALFGSREGRTQDLARAFISRVSRGTARLVAGSSAVHDVNTAYRLMRSAWLRPIIASLPDDLAAPNVIISAALSRAGARVFNHPVPFQPRRTGSISIVRWRLFKLALRAFLQTIRHRPMVSAETIRDAAPQGSPATARRAPSSVER